MKQVPASDAKNTEHVRHWFLSKRLRVFRVKSEENVADLHDTGVF